MSSNISIVGSGYVGLVTGMGFVKLGNRLILIDIDDNKIEQINEAKAPIFEEGLEELMNEYKDNYHATKDYTDSIMNSVATFISVGTPSDDKGIDLTYVKAAAKEIGLVLKEKNDYHVVVVKSTVIPGTTEDVVKPILEEYSGKVAYQDFGLAMNPEFLREGVALQDFLNPDRIVIGLNLKDERTRAVLEKVYEPFDVKKLFVEIKTAEMIKYVSNAFLATKISFANEIGNLCKQLGIDTYDVFNGVGLDHRINPNFFQAGAGFGGSCFPKDVKALIRNAESMDELPRILNAAMETNKAQPLRLISILKKHITDLNGAKIGLLGLAFKPNSDDIRESRAMPMIDELIKNGAQVVANDPQAMENFKELYPQIEYKASANEVLENTEIIIIQTLWDEYESLDFSGKIVIDGRRLENAKRTAKVYEGLCW